MTRSMTVLKNLTGGLLRSRSGDPSSTLWVRPRIPGVTPFSFDNGLKKDTTRCDTDLTRHAARGVFEGFMYM